MEEWLTISASARVRANYRNPSGRSRQPCSQWPLIESHAHPVVSFPDDAARQLQTIIRHDQIEPFLDRDHPDRIRKLDRGASGGKVTDRTRVFVAPILGYGSLVALVAWGDPGFVHRKRADIKNVFGHDVPTRQASHPD